MSIIIKYVNRYVAYKNIYLIISTIGMLLCFTLKLDSYAKYISAIILFAGLPFIFYEIWSKKIKELPYIKWCLLFIFFYTITLVLSSKTDFVSSVHVYVWHIFYLCLLYSSGNAGESLEIKVSNASKYFKIIECVMLIVTLFGLTTFLFQNMFNSDVFFLGGRSRGMLIDPIQLSWVAYILITSSMSVLTLKNNHRKWKIISTISIVVGFLTVIISMTRNTEYSVFIYFTLLSFLFIYIRFQNKKVTAILLSSLGAVLVFLGIFISYPYIKNSLSIISSSIKITLKDKDITKDEEATKNKNDETQNSVPIVDDKATSDTPLVEEPAKNNTKEGISNEGLNEGLERSDYENGIYKYGLSGRWEIWTMGMNVVKEYPLFGVGSGDMKYKTIEVNKDKEVYKKTYPYFKDQVFISQHNGFMQILVASGILGLIFSCGFMILLTIRTLKFLFLKKTASSYFIASLAANVAVIFYVLSFGQSISYFLISYFSVYFWICLGYLSNLIKCQMEREESKDKTLCEKI